MDDEMIDPNPLGIPPGPPVWNPPPIEPAPSFHSIGGLGLVAQALLTLCVVMALATIAATQSQVRVIQRILNGASPSLNDVQAADSTAQTVQSISLLISLATGITFIIWFYRARINAGRVNPRLQKHGEGWAIGGWFCPFVNLVMPAMVANDIVNGSEQPPHSGPDVRRSSRLVTAWWLAFTIAGLVRLSARTSSANTAEAFISAARRQQTANVLLVLAAVLAVLLVRRVATAQRRLATC